jgi:hypothetical protein
MRFRESAIPELRIGKVVPMPRSGRRCYHCNVKQENEMRFLVLGKSKIFVSWICQLDWLVSMTRNDSFNGSDRSPRASATWLGLAMTSVKYKQAAWLEAGEFFSQCSPQTSGELP